MTEARTAVLDAVDALADHMASLLVELVRIPSVTGTADEHEAQEWLAGQMLAADLEVDHWQIDLAEMVAHEEYPGTEAPRDEAWGLVGRLPGRGGGPSLMLGGHIDVVPAGDGWSGDPFSGDRRGGAVVGRGACDMKGGLIAGYWAVRALASAGVALRGDVLLASVESEEDGGLGTFATLHRGWTPDVCVIPEPTGLDLVVATAGALTFRLRIRGLATHASRRTEGVSAVEKFWPVWQALGAFEQRRNASVDPLVQRWPIAYPLSIGRVTAGVWSSSVPDTLVAEGRLGVALDESVGDARAAMEAAVAEACADDPWLRDHPVEVEWWGGQFAPGRLPAGSDLGDALARCHRAAGGSRSQQRWGAPYGSDLRLFTAAGVPTVHYGPGDVTDAHGPDESVLVDEVALAARTLALLALDRCG